MKLSKSIVSIIAAACVAGSCQPAFAAEGNGAQTLPVKSCVLHLTDGSTVNITQPNYKLSLPQGAELLLDTESDTEPVYTTGNGHVAQANTFAPYKDGKAVYSMYGIGKVGSSTGLYLRSPGSNEAVRMVSVTLTARPFSSDTTVNMSMKQGASYTFEIDGAGVQNFDADAVQALSVGNSSVFSISTEHRCGSVIGRVKCLKDANVWSGIFVTYNNVKYKIFSILAHGKTDKLAQPTEADRVDAKAKKIVASITSSGWSKGAKLKTCFNWLAETGKYNPAFDLKNQHCDPRAASLKSDWLYYQADRMLTQHRGNCYSYACAFAALAHACGYNTSVVTGSCTSASGGTTPHGWTEVDIDGRAYYFDTEMDSVEHMGGTYKFLYSNAPMGYYAGKTYSWR